MHRNLTNQLNYLMTNGDSLQMQELKEPFKTKCDCFNLTCNRKIKTDRNRQVCEIFYLSYKIHTKLPQLIYYCIGT